MTVRWTEPLVVLVPSVGLAVALYFAFGIDDDGRLVLRPDIAPIDR